MGTVNDSLVMRLWRRTETRSLLREMSSAGDKEEVGCVSKKSTLDLLMIDDGEDEQKDLPRSSTTVVQPSPPRVIRSLTSEATRPAASFQPQPMNPSNNGITARMFGFKRRFDVLHQIPQSIRERSRSTEREGECFFKRVKKNT
eukprot:TRINITY_DN4289_c0_g2_i5.p1 TRINITY_DN4289_c0_g2~~TRINITY_DN4289_c0_g2_i5.p1  ORF type:complete len:153 (-),score=19.97 TRINITY_DN4289_c0_g2_i5:82-513(-)